MGGGDDLLRCVIRVRGLHISRPAKLQNVTVRFFSLFIAEIWHRCYPRGPELGTWGANLGMWDKCVKFKMASSGHFFSTNNILFKITPKRRSNCVASSQLFCS